MRTLGKQIIVSRGEVFVMARKVIRQNNTPYILRSQLKNPYLLIAVSSNTYKLQGKYLKNYWLDLSSYPKFETLEIKDLTKQEFDTNTLPSGYTATKCIYKYVSSYGDIGYYYYKDNKYTTYEFSFVKTFLNVDTREWIESNYQYEIRLVSGEKTSVVLTDMFVSLFPDTIVPNTLQEIWTAINEVRPDLVANISVTAPLASFDTNDIFVPPSVMTIKANV